MAACNSAPREQKNSDEAIVKEVLQAGVYTYLKVDKNKEDLWIAVPAMEAEPGDIYYFDGGLEMKDFESKELGRTFKSVLFVETLSTTPPGAETPATGSDAMGGTMEDGTVHAGRVEVEKKEIKVEHGAGEITIAELFKNKNDYSGKKIRVKGQVTKFNQAIMDRNWVHIQDGTEHQGHFDLTATTAQDFEVGSTVVLEGMVSLDKDFGYGYVYEILLEDAVVLK